MVIIPVDVPYCLRHLTEAIYFFERRGMDTDHYSIADVRSGIFIRWGTSECTVRYDGKVLGKSYVWGASSYPKTVRFTGHIKAVVLILKPDGFIPGLCPADVLDKTLYLDDLFPSLQKKLQSAGTVTELLSLLYSEIFASTQPAKINIDNRFRPVIHALHSAHTLTDIHRFCAQTGISERSLERKMKLLLGLSPKAFQNIARFQTVYRDLLSENRSLTDLAYGHRFSDHSHFTREFKRYAGFLPSKVRQFHPQII